MIYLSNLNRFSKFFPMADSPVNFAVKWLLRIPPHLVIVATLPCEILMPENKRLTINFKVVQQHI